MGVVFKVVISLSALASYIHHSGAFLYVTPLFSTSLWGLQVSSAASSFRSIWRMSGTTLPDLDQPNAEDSRPLGSPPPFRAYFKVVTAVVQDASTGRILTLKRSKEVRSFAEHWHFISGGMEEQDEGDVVRRCWKELEEEVKLTEEDLELRTKGRPLLVRDSRGRPLLVHPVLFHCLRPLSSSPSSENGPSAVSSSSSSSSGDGLSAVSSSSSSSGGGLSAVSSSSSGGGLSAVSSSSPSESGLSAVSSSSSGGGPSAAKGPIDDASLNWENTELQWATMQQLKEGGLRMVPRLVETAERVLHVERRGAWAPVVQEAVQRIVEDRDHGAMQLAGWAVHALDTWADAMLHSDAPLPPEGLEADLRDLGYTLANTRPAMAAVGNAVATVVNHALEAAVGPTGTPALLRAVKQAAADFERDSTEASHTLSEVAAAEIRRRLQAHTQAQAQTGARRRFTIITLSLSSTLTSLFRRLAEPPGSASEVHVVVCESRPLLEGAKLASLLSDLGYHVTLITDAQMGVFAACSDVALLGADAVHPGTDTTEAQVVNKVGSLPLSLCCRHVGVPVVAVTSSLKVSPWPAGPDVEGEEKGPEELTTTAAGLQALPQGPGGVEVRNVYFEGVAMGLVDALVVEHGPLERDGVRALADKRREAYETAFFGPR